MAVKFAGKAKKLKNKVKPKSLKKGDLIIDVKEGLVATAYEAFTALGVAKDENTVLGQNLTDALVPLLEATADAEKDQKVIVKDGSHILKLGEMGKSTEITGDMEKIHELLGDEVFYAVAKVGIGDLKKYLTPDELKKITKEHQKGARSKKYLAEV